jgi:hypothetical protein
MQPEPRQTQDSRQPPALSPSAVSDIIDLVNGGEHIRRIMDACAGAQPAASLYRLSCRVAEQVGLTPDVANDVLFGLLNIHRLKRGLDGAGIFELVTTTLREAEDSGDWQPFLERWNELRPQVVNALDSMDERHPVVVSNRAEGLLRSQQNILISCRIITDARSVFDAAGEQILGTAITHSLLMHYSTGSHQDHATISIALTPGDIEALQAACVRAKKKESVLTDGLLAIGPVFSD